MADSTNIEWADATWSPWEGCQKVSPACDHCYAENRNQRFRKGENWGPGAPRRLFAPSYYSRPARWQKQAGAFYDEHARCRTVFPSLCDPFDKAVDPAWRGNFWNIILDTPDLIWLLLTKRPQNIKKYLPGDWGDGYPNVWLGTTAENQEELNRRVHHLQMVKAVVHFLSCEPLLGPLDTYRGGFDILRYLKSPQGKKYYPINWVIAGGESGHHARPSHPDWFRSLRDQCKEAGVPFLFKQWGEWLPWEPDQMPCWKSQDGQL
ncbi:MAG: phage Gp37/Gp68 family protein, partial [bacterium]|nr:phage Gp37/Gp68 family protein [bacterium]